MLIFHKLLQEIFDRVRVADNRMVIGISWHGAAEKTTFANRLINQ